MKKDQHLSTSLISHIKDSHYESQLQQTKLYFEKNTASRFMCAVDSKIPIQNVCRYVDMLAKADSIQVIRKDKCLISGEWVEYLSCDSKLFVKSDQLSLFGKECIK